MSNTKSEEQKKPQKRIEYKGKNVRVSRTGGIAVTKTFKKGGVGATLLARICNTTVLARNCILCR